MKMKERTKRAQGWELKRNVLQVSEIKTSIPHFVLSVTISTSKETGTVSKLET